MEMIIDRDNSAPFTMVPNAVICDDNRLSWKAKGLYVYLISRPKGWIMRLTDLVNRSKDGRDAVMAALSELEECGLIARGQCRDESGRLGRVRIKVHMPGGKCENQALPLTGFPVTAKPFTGNPFTDNPTHSNIDLSKTDLSKNEDINTPPTPQGGSEVEAGQAPTRKPRRASTLSQADLALFEQWYGAYPRKVSRGDAEKAWRSITPSKALLEEMMAALAWQVRSHDWTKDNGSFIPYPATYLRAKKWMDQPTAAACSNGSFSQASYETKSDVQDLLRQMGRI